MGKKKSTGEKEKRVDLYELMKVHREAIEIDIQKAYNLFERKVHPDKNPNDPQAEENFKALQQAYEILKDPVKRKHYDRTGSVGDDMMDRFWKAYQSYKTVEIREKGVESYLHKFRYSSEEKRDLTNFFNKFKGNVTTVLAHIVGSEDEDTPRFVEFFEQGLENGELDAEYKEAFETTKGSILSLAELYEVESESESDDDDEEDGNDLEDGNDEEDDTGEEDGNHEDDGNRGEGGKEDDDDDFSPNEEDEDGKESFKGKKEESEDGNREDEDTEKPKFHVGDVVDAWWMMAPKYYQGIIKNVDAKAGRVTYDVEFQHVEKGLQESHIRPSKEITVNSKSTKRKANAATAQKVSCRKRGR